MAVFLDDPANLGRQSAREEAMHTSSFLDDSSRIPRFFLYGEPPRAVDDRFVHLELLDERSRPANWTIRPHSHLDLHHVFHMRAGGGVVDADGDRIPFRAPCLVVVPAGVVHGFRYEPDTEGQVLTFADALLRDLAQREPRLRAMLDRRTWVGAIQGNRLPEGLAHLARELAWHSLGHELAVLSQLGGVLIEALRIHHDSAQQSSHPPSAHAALVARYRELIERDFRQHRSIEDAALELGVSPRRLRAACEAEGAGSPLELRQARLLLEARRLMRYSNMNVAQIGAYLGFQDAAYFTRMFARATGMSPRAFRAQLLAER